MKQPRKCEVTFAYSPMNEDELSLVVGETVEIIREIEDGWWMGVKNGKFGAFPSNFVTEIFVSPKDGKHNEGKARPKLTDAVFNKEISQRASLRNKARNVVECCQVMFDYKAKAEDELDMQKGDVVVIVRKETEDEGWWEGELNGRCGFFPDNFVMVIPPMDSQSGTTGKPPERNVSKRLSVKTEASVMERGGPAKTKDDKPEVKDLRSNPPTKVKLPSINKPSPPPVKDKPNKVLPNRANGDVAPVSLKQPEEKEADQFDGVELQTEKLSHPTANRAKPPQRRPPSGLVAAVHAQSATDQTEPELSPQKFQTEKLPGFQKGTEILLPPARPDLRPKTPPPVRPAPPKVVVDGRTVTHREEPTVESLQADIKELRMALELLQTRHERDMQEVKEELREERNKRLVLQEEVHSLTMKH